MKVIAFAALVVAAFFAAGNAEAGWCGEADAVCSASLAYVECADGAIWLVDPALVDPAAIGGALCSATFVLLEPPAAVELSAPPPSGPYDLDPAMSPDPELYAGEVQCPDGSVWAVARGDDFSCPP